MIIQTSPNNWSCVPYAFATATGIEVTTLLDTIGHDGSEIIFPDLEEPFCRRGFLGQEVVLALYSLGWLASEFQFEPFGFYDDTHAFTIEYSSDMKKSLSNLLENSIGVVCGAIKTTGKQHAVAWDGKQCYDPTGFIYPLDRYDIYVYYTLKELSPARVE